MPVLTVALYPLPSLLIAQVKRVFCEASGSMVAKDKAVKRFLVRNIVESAAIRDLQESCVYDCTCHSVVLPFFPFFLTLNYYHHYYSCEGSFPPPFGLLILARARSPPPVTHNATHPPLFFSRSLQRTCCPSSTARCTTASPPPFTPRWCACDRARLAASASPRSACALRTKSRTRSKEDVER